MEQADLAREAGVALALVARVEAVDGMAMMRKPDALAVRSVLEAAGVEFIPEGSGGAGVRLHHMTAFETALASLTALHGSADPLDRVDVIAVGFSDEDRNALSLAFGDRVWRVPNLPSDARGAEIQDRLVFPERFGS
ncbi:hypothetical protein [Lichenibacterium dinghuense]|uniref:hypothetical protein n=1 Tax=Lichenibacterium dinghuense TaxID=2895977 RepID=UPI001F441357|nr:hypothetical protein [Lichenibacterium sp. 6Y81]